MRKSNVFWGVIILLAGVLLLLDTLNIIPSGWGSLFWPLLLVFLGLWFLLAPRGSRRWESGGMVTEGAQKVEIALENSTEAEVEINHGAGRLEVHAGPDPAMLLSGSFDESLRHSVRREAFKAFVKLDADGTVFVPPMIGSHGIHWNMGLAKGIPLSLRLHTGANETVLDLRDLQVTDLRIETGASSTRVDLPAAAGMTRVKVEGGAASVDFTVPQGVAARIRVDSGLSGVNIDTLRFPQTGNVYQSADYDTAVNKIELTAEMGAGSVSVH